MISIIIPSYNAAGSLEKCLSSLAQQQYRNLDIILVDDGSQDQTADIAGEYASRDSRVRYFYQENQGVSAARNRGLNEALGKYVCFVDSDDWVEPDYISILVSKMTEDGLTACHISNDTVIPGGDEFKLLSKAEAQQEAFGNRGFQGFPWNKMFDINTIRRNHISFDVNVTMCEDLLFLIQYISCVQGPVVFMNCAPYHYVVSKSGTVKSRYKKQEIFNRKSLSESEGVRKCRPFILKEAQEAWKMRLVKAEVNTLRVLCANEMMDDALYPPLMQNIRNNLISFLKYPYSAGSSKVSVFLSAISPKLEFFVYKLHNR